MKRDLAHMTPPAGDDAAFVIRTAVHGLGQMVLRTDVAGMPLEWIDYREAARLYHQQQVAYSCGSLLYRLHGGHNALNGRRTVVEVNSIVATLGHTGNPGNSRHDYVPPLNNETLFRRDAYLCMYCAQRFQAGSSRAIMCDPSSRAARMSGPMWLAHAAVAITSRPGECRSRPSCS